MTDYCYVLSCLVACFIFGSASKLSFLIIPFISEKSVLLCRNKTMMPFDYNMMEDCFPFALLIRKPKIQGPPVLWI